MRPPHPARKLDTGSAETRKNELVRSKLYKAGKLMLPIVRTSSRSASLGLWMRPLQRSMAHDSSSPSPHYHVNVPYLNRILCRRRSDGCCSGASEDHAVLSTTFGPGCQTDTAPRHSTGTVKPNRRTTYARLGDPWVIGLGSAY